MKKSSNKKSELIKKNQNQIAQSKIDMGIANANVPADLYSKIPCTIGFSYLRFEVDGKIRPCCIAKYEIGHLDDGDWRETWHSGAWMAFRQKMARIHIEKFHLTDPEWSFCQQCSHMTLNQVNYKAIKDHNED